VLFNTHDSVTDLQSRFGTDINLSHFIVCRSDLRTLFSVSFVGSYQFRCGSETPVSWDYSRLILVCFCGTDNKILDKIQVDLH